MSLSVVYQCSLDWSGKYKIFASAKLLTPNCRYGCSTNIGLVVSDLPGPFLCYEQIHGRCGCSRIIGVVAANLPDLLLCYEQINGRCSRIIGLVAIDLPDLLIYICMYINILPYSSACLY